MFEREREIERERGQDFCYVLLRRVLGREAKQKHSVLLSTLTFGLFPQDAIVRLFDGQDEGSYNIGLVSPSLVSAETSCTKSDGELRYDSPTS